jgi:hypothetical protein
MSLIINNNVRLLIFLIFFSQKSHIVEFQIYIRVCGSDEGGESDIKYQVLLHPGVCVCVCVCTCC